MEGGKMKPQAPRATIDGFVRRSSQPLQPRSPRPKSAQAVQAAAPAVVAAQHVPAPSARRHPRPNIARQPQPPAATTSQPKRAYAKPQPDERPSFWQRLQLPLVILGGLIIGFFMQSLTFGVALIALYGVLAVICKVQSRVTFVLSFLSLVATVLLLVIKRNPEQSGNFATYTFLLLVVAVISLMIESKTAKPHYKKR
jgi:hypothetical protein